jgi:RNA polymerase sigma factor (sigma-70 family)
MIVPDRTKTHALGSTTSSGIDRDGAWSRRRGAVSPRRESDVAWPGEGRRMPAGEGSITHCLIKLEAGDETAVRAVLDCYLDRLEIYARRMLRSFGASCAVEDEQDLAHEAILIVVVGIRGRKYKDLHDRQALSRLLLTITRRLVIKLKRDQTTRRRTGRPGGRISRSAPTGPGDLVAGSEAPGRGAADEWSDGPGPGAGRPRTWGTEEALAQVPDRARNPQEVLAIGEELRAVLDVLEDERDRDILRLKLEDYTHAEIAERLDCSKRTVSLRFQRVCDTIRKLADEQGRPHG